MRNRNLTKQGQYTAKEAAVTIAMAWVRQAYNEGTGDLEEMDDRPSMQRAIKKHLATIHNRLLETTRMDGMHIGEEA